MQSKDKGRKQLPHPLDPGWPRPLGPAAMQGLVGETVRAIAPHTEADPAALVLQILVAFGNVIGRKPHFYVGQTRHGLNLYTVLVGKTARARKGTSWDFIASPFRLLDPQWIEECVQGGLSTGEGVIVRAAGGEVGQR